MRRILEGIAVLDFTQVIAGPLCTRMLADMGARVTKVDRPAGADGPARSSGSAANNAGKRSIAIDLQSGRGAALARELAARADVVVENFTPGVMERLGLGYEALAAANPRLVYASISGFGQEGSLSHRRAYGATAHAEAGFLWVQQQAAGAPAPFAPGLQVADVATAMSAFSAVLAALYDRERTGRGQRIDVTLMESQLAMLAEVAAGALGGAPDEEWQPFRHPIHRSRDGRSFTINLGGTRNWPRLARGLGHPERAEEPAPADASALVGRWVAELDADAVVAGLEREGAPYGLVHSMGEALAHPLFRERETLVEVPDPLAGSLRVVRTPLRFSDAEVRPEGRPPLAGEHTRAVLAEDLGYSGEGIDELLAAGVVTAV